MFKNIIFQIGSTLIAVAVLAYLVFHTLSSFENELEVKNAYYTTMELTYDTTAYIFRDEALISSSKSGYALYEFENGEKIKINQKIASVFTDLSSFNTQTKINNLKKEIDYLNKIVSVVKYSTPSIPSLDKGINERIENVAASSNGGDLRNALTASKESIYELELKYCILNGTEEYENKIKSYQEEISRLSSSSSGNASTILAPCSGYFYNESDGYEEIFTFEKIDSLSSDLFEHLKNASPNNQPAVGKIVKNSKWYIAFELNTNDAINLSPNKKYSVSFSSSDKKIDMKLEKRIDSSDETKKILVMSSNSILENFNFSRKQIISITAATYSGLAFPATAVHTDFDSTGANKAGVYVLDETIVKFKTFDRIMEKNGYILCSVPDSTNISTYSNTKLSLFDAVIVKGTNLYHNKVIKNILKSN